MLMLPYGGEIIDIPGVRSFGTIDFTEEDTGHFFLRFSGKAEVANTATAVIQENPDAPSERRSRRTE